MTPRPTLLSHLTKEYCSAWVDVTDALPPERIPVLVAVRGDDMPAYAFLRFAAGDKECPYFVCPQIAAMEPRNCRLRVGPSFAGRKDITHWFSPSELGLPRMTAGRTAAWGLGSQGWESFDCAKGAVNVQ